MNYIDYYKNKENSVIKILKDYDKYNKENFNSDNIKIINLYLNSK